MEGLPIALSVGFYARTRFILNLLPNLKRANGLSRVVSVLAGGHEGPIESTDFQGRTLSMMKLRGHMTSMTDLAMEKLSEYAPEVSFINDFPGAVKSGIGREANTVMTRLLSMFISIIGPFVFMPTRESGERHLFFATSAKYPPRDADVQQAGVPLPTGVNVAYGTDGRLGSGVYSVHFDGESSGANVVDLLATLREQGMVQKVWQHILSEYKRITGNSGL